MRLFLSTALALALTVPAAIVPTVSLVVAEESATRQYMITVDGMT